MAVALLATWDLPHGASCDGQPIPVPPVKCQKEPQLFPRHDSPTVPNATPLPAATGSLRGPHSPVTRTSAVRHDTQRKTKTSATTASVRVQLNLLPLPSSTCVLQPLAGSSLGTGPAPVTETHDSFVFSTSQMTSIQQSRLPFISLLVFIFAFGSCHPILVFKGPYCACV